MNGRVAAMSYACPPVESDEDRRRFRVSPARSAVLIEARSNVGPIAFGATGIEGHVEATFEDSAVGTTPAPTAHLEVKLASLQSGNKLYDAELLRRINARQHPVTTLELTETTRLGDSGRYQVTGVLTFHGITRTITGTVELAVAPDATILVSGEHVFDIRDFDINAPNVLMLRIYPDVRVQLQLEAEVEG